MQLTHHKSFEKRAQYYAAKAYSQQILKEADFIMFPEKKGGWKSEHRILDEKTYENDLKDFYFVFIELDKFNKTIEESVTLEEKWCYFFKYADESTLAEALLNKSLPLFKYFGYTQNTHYLINRSWHNNCLF